MCFGCPTKALRVRVASLDATVADVLKRGQTYFARVTHHEDPQAETRTSTTIRMNFCSSIAMIWALVTGTRSMSIAGLPGPKSMRRFDHQQLRKYVGKRGKLVGPTRWYKSNTEVPAQVEIISIMVLPSAPEFVVVPGFRSVERASAMLGMRLFWIAIGIAGACLILFGIFVGQTAGPVKD